MPRSPKATATSEGRKKKRGRSIDSNGVFRPTPESVGMTARQIRGKLFPPKRRRRKGHKPHDKRGNGHGQTSHKFDNGNAVLAAVLAHLGVPQKMIAEAVGLGSINTLVKYYGEAMGQGIRFPVAMAEGAMFKRSLSEETTPGAFRSGIAVLEEYAGWNAHKRQIQKGNGIGARVINQDAVDFTEKLKLAYQEMPEDQRPVVREFLAIVQDSEGEDGD